MEAFSPFRGFYFLSNWQKTIQHREYLHDRTSSTGTHIHPHNHCVWLDCHSPEPRCWAFSARSPPKCKSGFAVPYAPERTLPHLTRHKTGRQALGLWCLDIPLCGWFKAGSALQAPSTQPDPFSYSDLWQPHYTCHSKQTELPTIWVPNHYQHSSLLHIDPGNTLNSFSISCSLTMHTLSWHHLGATYNLSPLDLTPPDQWPHVPHLLQPSSVCLNEVQYQSILSWLVPLVLSLGSPCQTHVL